MELCCNKANQGRSNTAQNSRLGLCNSTAQLGGILQNLIPSRESPRNLTPLVYWLGRLRQYLYDF